MGKFDLIAFDADDTLWHNESLYQEGRERFKKLLAKYPLDQDVDPIFDEIEIRNLQYYGYGVTGFVFSLIEAAIKLTRGEIQGRDIGDLVNLSKEMLTAEIRLFDGVEDTLEKLARDYPLMLITKGDLLHQQSKVTRSGIQDFFRSIEIVSDKKPENYAEILSRHHLSASRFLMVGNSLRSDILPVLEIGGWAVYVPNHFTWAHEHVEPPGKAHERFFEIEQIDGLAELIESITASKETG